MLCGARTLGSEGRRDLHTGQPWRAADRFGGLVLTESQERLGHCLERACDPAECRNQGLWLLFQWYGIPINHFRSDAAHSACLDRMTQG